MSVCNRAGRLLLCCCLADIKVASVEAALLLVVIVASATLTGERLCRRHWCCGGRRVGVATLRVDLLGVERRLSWRNFCVVAENVDYY